MKKATATLLILCLAVQPALFSAAPSRPEPRFLSPRSSVPAASFRFTQDGIPAIPNATFSGLPYSHKNKRPIELHEVDETVRYWIERSMEIYAAVGTLPPEEEMTLFYLDFNNLKLRNWIYTNEIMDVVIRDLDDEIARMVEGISRDIEGKKQTGFYCKKGGDERVVILPTSDPKVIEHLMESIKAYVRRVLPSKYRIAVLQLDDDSRTVTRGKENEKSDLERQELFEGKIDPEGHEVQKGIVTLLENSPSVIQVLRHADQYYLVYDSLEALEEVFMGIQQIYPDHNIDFKSHPYFEGRLDTFSLSMVGCPLSVALRELDGFGPDAADQALQNWIERAEVGSIKLAERGKDNYVMLAGSLEPARAPQTGRYARPGRVLNTEPRRPRYFDGQKLAMSDEEWIRFQATLDGNFVSGQEDSRFRRFPKKRTAVDIWLRSIKTPGYLVQLDIGYLSNQIKKMAAEFETVFREEIIREFADAQVVATEEEIRRKVRDKWFSKFRVLQPHVTGVNTKFLNEVIKHSGTDDIISALLYLVWVKVRELNQVKVRERKNWNGNILVFRGPPDSIYLWFPTHEEHQREGEVQRKANREAQISRLKSQVDDVLKSLRGEIREMTVDAIDLSFVVSVLVVHDPLIPRGNRKRAFGLLESMERACRVFVAMVLAEQAHVLEENWEKWQGVSSENPPEVLEQICSRVIAVFKQDLEELDPEHSQVSFDGVGDDKFLAGGKFFLVYNGNIDERAEKIQLKLAFSSKLDALNRFFLEKEAKWNAEVARAAATGKINYDEMFYILSAILRREKELGRFKRKALSYKLNDPANPAALFDEIRKRRIAENEKIFALTGLFFHEEKGVYVPKTGARVRICQALEEFGLKEPAYVPVTAAGSRVREVLANKDPKRNQLREWKRLRRRQHVQLQFSRNFELFNKTMRAYQELLNTVPTAKRLLLKLAEKHPALFQQLTQSLETAEILHDGSEKLKEDGATLLLIKNGVALIPINSLNPSQLKDLKIKIHALLRRSGDSGAFKTRLDAIESSI